MPGRTSGRSAWLPVALWLIVIFAFSSVPDLGPPDIGLPMSDKLAHLGEYGILGVLLGRARAFGSRRGRAVVLAALLGLGIGALDETYQRRTPGREVSALDALADSVGVALGTLAWGVFEARSGRRRAPEGRR